MFQFRPTRTRSCRRSLYVNRPTFFNKPFIGKPSTFIGKIQVHSDSINTYEVELSEVNRQLTIKDKGIVLVV